MAGLRVFLGQAALGAPMLMAWLMAWLILRGLPEARRKDAAASQAAQTLAVPCPWTAAPGERSLAGPAT